jgi:hypothetical protein
MTPLTEPCSPNAFSVPSGMVSTVNGAASACTYSVSGAFGSLVPVLAHNSRCARAPMLAARCQRVEPRNCW